LARAIWSEPGPGPGGLHWRAPAVPLPRAAMDRRHSGPPGDALAQRNPWLSFLFRGWFLLRYAQRAFSG